jgi:hypothetical protein
MAKKNAVKQQQQLIDQDVKGKGKASRKQITSSEP